MRTVVIYPGRFHPFHRGHKASYDYLVKRYGDRNVFVVSSDKQDPETSPFSFADKMSMMTKLGISPGQIAQVRNPYQAQEIKSEIDDPENTILIFAVSEKDMSGEDARFTFGAKKDGTPSYMQPLPSDGKGMQNMTKHAYVAVTPTVNFRVRGADANSASQIRKEYIKGNDADREQIIADLYGDVDTGIRDIFDLKLGTGRPVEMVSESHARIAEKINQLRERIAQLKEVSVDNESADYIEEKWSKKYKRSINCNNPRGFSQRAHCAGRKK
jgi:nicotinamide mononucleotide adenylyltransferase